MNLEKSKRSTFWNGGSISLFGIAWWRDRGYNHVCASNRTTQMIVLD